MAALFWSFCVVLVLSYVAESYYSFSSAEFQALEEFYDALHGESWMWRSNHSLEVIVDDDYLLSPGTITNHGAIWNFTGVHDPCQEHWQGINCTCSDVVLPSHTTQTNCSVVSIELAAYNLTGQIPDSIESFRFLRVLYLTSNNITGTIPTTLASLTNLHFLSLAYNYLESTIPWQLGLCQNLQHLHLDYNFLTGTIPSTLYNIEGLLYLNLESNNFHGEFSSSIGKLFNLNYLYLNSNSFTGSIPEEIGNCTMMLDLYLYENLLHGNITDSIKRMNRLNFLYIFDNMITGTIPSWIGTTTSRLISFDASLTQITGSIPYEMCREKNNTLAGVLLYSNQLTGTIPSCFGRYNSTIVEFVLYDNHLTGIIPSGFKENKVLESLVVGKNHLSGTLPSLAKATLLEYLYVQNNMLTGNLYNILNADTQNVLQYVDFSNNEFTGTIPESLYGIKYIRSLAMVSNCFTGSISSSICNMTFLQYLDFDGLHTADSCQHRLFPFLSSYIMSTRIHGTVPPCLFQLRHLQTIHMSGNAIDSTLPEHLEISESITDITLSHNMMRGPIPIALQTRRFSTLDLSYNCFSGGLHPEFNLSDYTSVEVNRLSGAVPPAFRHAKNIKILNSNLYACDLEKSTLPLNDPDYSSFECGSNAFNQSLVIWGILCFFAGLVAAVAFGAYQSKVTSFYQKYKEYLSKQVEYFQICLSVFDPIPEAKMQSMIVEFAQYLTKLRITFLRLTVVVCVVLLPLYFILSAFYATHSHEYAWNASALYLSGETPAMILLIVFLGLLAFIFWSLRKLLWQWLQFEAQIDDATSNESHISRLAFNRKRLIVLCLVATVNCTMMLVLNSLYVYFVFEYNAFIVFVCQLLIAVIKIFWNEYALTWMVRTGREKTKDGSPTGRPLSRALSANTASGGSTDQGVGKIHHGWMDRERDLHELKELQDVQRLQDAHDMPVLTFIVIFNTIIAPVIANSVLSDQCYESVFFPPASVNSAGAYSVCEQKYSLLVTSVFCQQDSTAYLNTQYDPPFIYRYGCSSSFIRHYASVYVYMFLLTGFGKPAGFALWKYIYETTKNHTTKIFMSMFLNKMLKEELIDVNRLQSGEIIFRKERFVLNNVSATCVLLTVGVVFPPLAVVVLFAIYSHTYMNQFIIGRFVKHFEGIARELVVKSLNRDCEGVAVLFKHSLLFTIPFTALFYGFYLIDIYGDAVGWRNAMWASVLIFSMPIFVFSVYQVYRIILAVQRQNKEHEEVTEKMGRARAATIAAMKRSSYYRRSSTVAGVRKTNFIDTEGRESAGGESVSNPMGVSVELTERDTDV